MQKKYILLLTFLLVCIGNFALIDNRFLPLYHNIFIRRYEKRSNINSNFFMMLAHDSRLDGNNEANIFDIYGKYDLIQITRSLESVGKTNPLKPEWQLAKDLVFDVPSKINAQGIWFSTELNLIPCFYVGARGALMHLNSSQRFSISETILKDLHLSDGGKILLDQERRESSCLLGITGEQWSVTGITDLDLYLRVGQIKEYTHKFKLIDYGFYLGLYLPVGTKRDICNSASIPLGGNGLTGLYGMFDINLEVKEDWWAGGWLQVVHRFAKNQKMRIPYNKEDQLFGALVETVYIDSGITVGASAYFRVLDFREGLGGLIQYTIIKHFEDEFPYLTNRTVANDLETHSSWLHEYFTVGIIYDINHAVEGKKYDPYLYINFDAPVYFVGAADVPKTFKLSLGIEINF